MSDLRPFDPQLSEHLDAAVAIWNAACGPALVASRRLVEFGTQPSSGAIQAGRLVLRDGRPVGFALASSALGTFSDMGWIDAIAVAPERQGQGVGGALLAWAEAWLAAQGCAVARLGGSLRPFAPGLPSELGTLAFFQRRGYAPGRHVWDVARRLRGYVPPDSARTDADIRLVRPGQEQALLDFLGRAFPGRWEYECREFFRAGGRASDFLALWLEGDVQGFCQLTLEDSLRPIERFYPQRLPRPWGQLGPLGVGEACRGKGYGAALLDAGLRHLRDRGVDGCVIDWVELLAFYGRFGFEPYRQYAVLLKRL